MIHISLGPTCFAAYVLKVFGLRSSSYPLDWARSGSTHLFDLVRMEPEEFYWAHIHTPSVQLEQRDNPEIAANNTAELVARHSIYGYPYFYNPHRKTGRNRAYHIRTLERWLGALEGTDRISFIVADHVARDGMEFFSDPITQIQYIEDTLAYRCRPQFGITMMRVSSCDKRVALMSYNRQKVSHRSSIINISMPMPLANTYATEQDWMCRILGRAYLHSCMNIE